MTFTLKWWILYQIIQPPACACWTACRRRWDFCTRTTELRTKKNDEFVLKVMDWIEINDGITPTMMGLCLKNDGIRMLGWSRRNITLTSSWAYWCTLARRKRAITTPTSSGVSTTPARVVAKHLVVSSRLMTRASRRTTFGLRWRVTALEGKGTTARCEEKWGFSVEKWGLSIDKWWFSVETCLIFDWNVLILYWKLLLYHKI